ncbi:putative endoribonuclease L-PSP [Hartmannibacter diazotrophicus]|uniref:Putative endoribonuclease L-PSP n=1 Tax=Hartmannibacter diazotrophicus TaxID=1482074 RepID=A0A2C9D8V5_9HYPH|nr:RidA family protein [Hartmannibacter diazotrophicus]SON56015.1 putative endoribonuclease L-PSP [Hartmannibacter diazotrophicus]
MSDAIETRIKELGYHLPEAPLPAAAYVPYVITGNLIFISGQISKSPGGESVVGKLGADLELEAGQAAARICALNILAQAKAAVGSLDRITRVVRLNGFVNATPDYVDHPKVINGASEFMGEVLGEKGTHSRCALGVSGLPFGVAVEIDAVIEFK